MRLQERQIGHADSKFGKQPLGKARRLTSDGICWENL